MIVEAGIGGRWRRFDSEIDAPRPGMASPMDFDFDSVGGRGFVTAALVWSAHGRGEIDPDSYGVDPEIPVLRGERFLFNEVILEIAHRFGDELLLWDSWGRIGPPESPVGEAERRRFEIYSADSGLRPGPTILQASPFGDPPISVDLGTDRSAS